MQRARRRAIKTWCWRSSISYRGERMSAEVSAANSATQISITDKTAIVELQQNLQAWLLGSTSSSNNIFDDAVRKRSEGTCDWIFERPVFKDWADTESAALKVLWVNGPAGFGKTVLCASVARHLADARRAPVVKFFFSSDFESRSDSFVAVRHWTYQMAVQNTAAFDIAYEAWLAQENSVAPKDTVDRVFSDMLARVSGCTLILDGLDECTSTNEMAVLRSIEGVARQATTTATHVLIVSRSEPEIRRHLDDMGHDIVFAEYRLSVDDVCSDIALYARHVVDERLPNKGDDVRNDIAARMAGHCEGQFLWVRLQADRLRRGMNRRQLQKAIAEAPAGLTSVYEKNWQLIAAHAPAERDRAFCILRWAAFSLRPLTVGEITEAVLLGEGGDDADGIPVDELPDELDDDYINSEILGLCGSLIEVRARSADDGADGTDDDGAKTVHITHFSVKEYLLAKLTDPGLPGQVLDGANTRLFVSSEARENLWLAKRCLQYVLFARTWDTVATKPLCGLDAALKGYAAGYWYQHARRGAGVADEDMARKINRLFDSGEATWRGWTKLVSHLANTPDPTDIAPKPSRLHFAAMLGLNETARHLIEQKKYDIDGKGAHGWTPLHVCCSEGSVSIAEALLEAGASALALANYNTTPIYLASCRGHVDIMKVLLARGVDADEPNFRGVTPVNIAACLGHLEAVQLLLEKSVNVDLLDVEGRSPLAAAAFNGHLEIVKLLIAKGVAAHGASEREFSSLRVASERGHTQVVRFLLDSGADIEIMDKKGRGQRPLHAAAEEGHAEVVRVLLASGANMRVQDDRKRTPLQLATAKGHIDVLKLLLEGGLDLDISEDVSLSLIEAAKLGRPEILKLLLAQEGVDVAVEDARGWQPMHHAALAGHTEILRLLHENGADLDFRMWEIGSSKYEIRTPVHLAACEGHAEALEYLLGQEVDARSYDFYGWTALSSAACHGHEAAVRVLLQHGWDLAAYQGKFVPLAMAARYNHVGTMAALLSHGADVDGVGAGPRRSSDGWGVNPLSMAAQFGHMEAARLLLAHGADIEKAKRQSSNRAEPVESLWHEEVVKLLRESTEAGSRTKTISGEVKMESPAGLRAHRMD
jgi:ankyrin repeat protein